MTPRSSRRSRHVRVAILAVLVASAPWSAAHAICNVIPGATREFRGALGVANRPFASPGDFVRLRVRPALCDAESTGFVDLEGGSQRGDDYVVTILFDPPDPTAPSNAVVLAEDCTALATQLATCDTALGAGTATCVDVDAGPGASGLVVPNDEDLSFRFPDTDGEVGTGTDDRTLTGPSKVIVTAVTAALPCGLASTRCADASGLVACIDELFEIDGTCRTQISLIDSFFPNFTALPPPNSYQAMCQTPGTPCADIPSDPELHFTVDKQGNILVPIDWSGVRVFLDGVPVPRLVRGNTSKPAFASAPGTPVKVPGKGFVSSHSPEGIRLPPIFTPIPDPAQTDLVLFGTIDAPRGVSRIARRSPVFKECSGGSEPGQPCTEVADCPGVGATCVQATCQSGVNVGDPCDEDADCPSSECGEALFDFSDRLEGDVGPVVIASAEYDAEAETPVPLDGLLETPAVFAFAVNEGLESEDRNADGDELDLVMTLGDREAGLGEPLSAVVRVRRPPFSFAAAVAEDDVTAYLESEPHEGDCSTPANCDKNGDDDVADTILRAYRANPSAPSTPTDLLPSANHCADGEPLVGDRPIALSDGLLFFRTPEAACAQRLTERVTVREDGGEASVGGAATDPSSMTQVLSADGSLVLVESTSTDMAAGKATSTNDVFLRDRVAETTDWLSSDSGGGQANQAVIRGHLSADGSTVVFDSTATDLVAGMPTDGLRRVFVHDVAGATTSLLGIPDPAGSCPGSATLCSSVQSVSATGRFVVFLSRATNLDVQATSGEHVFLHDRDTDEDGTFDELGEVATELVDVDDGGVIADGSGAGGAVSADGTRVAFVSNGTNLDPPDDNPFSDVFVRDRIAGTTRRVSVASDGTQGIGFGASPTISPDGRFVAFISDDNLLVPGDTNGLNDVFVHDLGNGLTERASVSSEGLQAEGGSSVLASLSDGGRFVAFPSNAENLIGPPTSSADTNGVRDVFVHDRVTGITQRVSLRNGGGEASLASTIPVSVSWDGQTVSFASADSSLVSGDLNDDPDTFVRFPDPGDPSGDLNLDGDVRDVHLRVVDTAESPATLTLLGPAGEVAVHEGSVALLRPEADGGSDLNADSDESDSVVHFWANRQVGAPLNLSRAAREVALSQSWIAALVPETGQGVADRNGDGDTSDLVVELNPVASVGAGSWTAPSPPQAAETLDVVGSVVAFLTDEAAQGAGGTVLNGDGDEDDRVLQLWNAGTSTLTNVGEAAEDFVLGENLVAFRTREASQGNEDLNLDGDTFDDVLQIRDLVTNQLVNTRRAVTPCHLEACDPRLPYRVSGDVVTFLTLEADQGNQDLDEDGDSADIVVQTFNVRKAIQVAVAEAGSVLSSADSGVCTVGGEACSTDDDCSAGVCFVPPGGCLEDLFIDCTLFPCLAGELCLAGSCHELQGPCQSDGDCGGAAFCHDVGQDIQKLLAPTNRRSKGEQVFVSKGLCTEDVPGSSCSAPEDCLPGQQCGENGACQITHGTCAGATDCPSAAVCRKNLVVVSADDEDADGVADPVDNCPRAANVAQKDGDEDGIGDACDRATCGDGFQTYQEGCDDGDRTGGDGCDSSCEPEGIACADGVDSDGDTLEDFPDDPGCTSAADTSERQDGLACDDGVNNDEQDELVDFPSDPGCRDAFWTKEAPACDDDLDNDNDGKIDWDGGPGGGIADPQCIAAWKNKEKAGCGLGGELVFVLWPLLWWRRRARRRQRSCNGPLKVLA